MEKYSAEWKLAQGSWIQEHNNEKWGKFYKLHYIASGTEYSTGEHLTKKEANEALATHKAAAALGRKGGLARSERKTESCRANARKPRRRCTHRSGSGEATQADRKIFVPGNECPVCGCTLGTDDYWYIDADQAPGYPF